MSTDKRQTDGESTIENQVGTADIGESADEVPGSDEREPVSPATRRDVLERDGHQCRVCGRRGPQRGGLATLHVHHINRNPPDGEDENDMEYLTTLCHACHNWVHSKSEPEDSPMPLSEADLNELLVQDIDILAWLADHGPARTGDIINGLDLDFSGSSIRERLWSLMGLDNLVEEREQQIVDKDVETGEWGLVGQIETSARGHIPDDPQRLLQRIEDELVREALDNGVDRQAVMEVLDVTRRTTYIKYKRACAYDFPLHVFRRGDGRPPTRDRGTDAGFETGDRQMAAEQQQLTAIASDRSEMQPRVAEDWTPPSDETIVKDEAGESREEESSSVRDELQIAIEALQQVQDEL